MQITARLRPFALVAGLLAAIACAPAGADSPPRAWRSIVPSGPVVGADGEPHVAACSGFPGTDPTFRFFARRGSSSNLVVYFDGGGACWDDFSCSFPELAGLPAEVPQLYTPAIAPISDPAGWDGIFNARRTANPVRDWNFVVIPYCSGDLHSGSATRTYSNFGHPVLPLPSQFDIRHGGYDNFMVVLNWMRRHLDEPEQVLVAGSSAGGYGAGVNFPWLRRAWPRAQMAVLADASQGITTATWDFSLPGRQSWSTRVPPGIPGNDPTSTPSIDSLRAGAAAMPDVRVAQFTTHFDLVQIGFYDVMKTNYPPGGACPNVALDWNGQMVSGVRAYAATLPNYRHYVAAGQYHTILQSPQFYAEASAGPAFRDWFAAMLDSDRDHRPPARWRNVACPGCLLSLPCP